MTAVLIALPWALLLIVLTLPAMVKRQREALAVTITDLPDPQAAEVQPRGGMTGPFAYDNGLAVDEGDKDT